MKLARQFEFWKENLDWKNSRTEFVFEKLEGLFSEEAVQKGNVISLWNSHYKNTRPTYNLVIVKVINCIKKFSCKGYKRYIELMRHVWKQWLQLETVKVSWLYHLHCTIMGMWKCFLLKYALPALWNEIKSIHKTRHCHWQEGKNWQCCKSSFLKLKMTVKVIWYQSSDYFRRTITKLKKVFARRHKISNSINIL